MPDLLLSAIVGGLAALVLIVTAHLLRRARKPRNYILIDGSNVMYWEDQSPHIAPVQQAVSLLTKKGYTPVVMFDANAGHVLFGRYTHDHHFANTLNVPADQIMVVDKGVQADVQVLKAARTMEAKVVTNDFFRDWAKDFPEVRTRGHLIHGGYHKGKLWLDFDGSRSRANKTRRKKR